MLYKTVCPIELMSLVHASRAEFDRRSRPALYQSDEQSEALRPNQRCEEQRYQLPCKTTRRKEHAMLEGHIEGVDQFIARVLWMLQSSPRQTNQLDLFFSSWIRRKGREDVKTHMHTTLGIPPPRVCNRVIEARRLGLRHRAMVV